MANLSQREIDALIESIGHDASVRGRFKPKSELLSMLEPVIDDWMEGPAPTYSGSDGRCYRLYDFRRPEKLSKEHNRQLRTHFGLFWRRIANYLGNLSRSHVDVNLVEVEQASYKEIFTNRGLPAVMATFRLGADQYGLIKLNLSLVYSLVDRLMGGTGNGVIRARNLTDFERSLCDDLLASMLRLYSEICDGQACQVENVETDERLLQRKLPGDEQMLRVIYDLRLGQQSGYLNLYVPLRSLVKVTGNAAKRNLTGLQEKRVELPPVVSRLPLPVEVVLGEATMPAHVLAALEPGSIIKLSQEEAKPLKVVVGGRPRFRGKAGMVGTRMAVSIVEPWEE